LATATVTDIAPTLTTPVISGTARQGQTLTATAAVANDSDATVSYQWQANHGAGFVNVAGAISLSYLLQQSDDGGALKLIATSTDSDGGGTTSASTATGIVQPDNPPTVATANLKVAGGQTLLASSLFAASDPDGDTITKYAFWDMGSKGGHFVLNGVTQPVQAEFDVTAVQLAQLTYQSGSGTDTVWVRANDGTLWSDWSTPLAR
jgi:hypothetical protein